MITIVRVSSTDMFESFMIQYRNVFKVFFIEVWCDVITLKRGATRFIKNSLNKPETPLRRIHQEICASRGHTTVTTSFPSPLHGILLQHHSSHWSANICQPFNWKTRELKAREKRTCLYYSANIYAGS